MKISVTWVTPREYSAFVDTAELLGSGNGTSHEPRLRRLLSQLETGSTLGEDEMTQLAAVIEQHAALLPEDEENWTSTGETEVTHVGIPEDG